jgi:hypothetical protein
MSIRGLVQTVRELLEAHKSVNKKVMRGLVEALRIPLKPIGKIAVMAMEPVDSLPIARHLLAPYHF